MNVLPYLFLLAVLQATSRADTPVSTTKFPSWFKWGVATASYQVEGAWNVDGKGENIWDHQAHFEPNRIENNDTGDIACNSYYKYKEDVKMLKYLGVSHYRFSLSWTRILPNGIDTVPNKAGIQYYKNLISALKTNNIEPLVTIFHWDTPQALQNKGGFANSSMVEWYSNYARICFKELGDSVKYWFTFNEPKQTCSEGYGSGSKAPFIKSPGIDEYKCTHNVIKAHAAAWHIYNNEFREKQNGKVGIVLDSNWVEPENNTNPDDLEAAETRRQFVFGIYASPLFFGKYPDVVVENIARRSRIQNYPISRLPTFSLEEAKGIKDTVDILGFNSYTSEMVRAVKNPDLTTMGLYADSEVEAFQPQSWPSSGSVWLKVVPWGMGKVLKWADKTYNHPEIFITENGISDRNGTLEDDFRIKYYQEYLTSIQNAMNEGVNVTRYTAWSLMDNFEWSSGYSEKFGLYHVDFSDPNRPRTAKKSAYFYKRLIQTNCLVETCDDS